MGCTPFPALDIFGVLGAPHTTQGQWSVSQFQLKLPSEGKGLCLCSSRVGFEWLRLSPAGSSGNCMNAEGIPSGKVAHWCLGLWRSDHDTLLSHIPSVDGEHHHGLETGILSDVSTGLYRTVGQACPRRAQAGCR